MCHGISCLPCWRLQLPRAHLQGAARRAEWLLPNFHLTCAVSYSLILVGISRIYITASRRDIKTKEGLLICNCTWEIFLNAFNMGLIFAFYFPSRNNHYSFFTRSPTPMSFRNDVLPLFFPQGILLMRLSHQFFPRSWFIIQFLWNTSMKTGWSIMGDTPPQAFCLWCLLSMYVMR